MKKPIISKMSKLSGNSKPDLPKLGEAAPDLASLEDPGDFNSPFDPDPAASRGLQEDVDEEMSEALRAILEEREQKRDKYRLTNDQDYYLVLCFQTEQQKLEFLDKSGWPHHEERLLDGLKIAREMGIHIRSINLPMSEFSKSMPVNLRDNDIVK